MGYKNHTVYHDAVRLKGNPFQAAKPQTAGDIPSRCVMEPDHRKADFI